MDDLISRSALLEKNMNVGLCDAYGDYYGCGDVVLTDDIKAAPAIDAVEVVRCKECKQYQKNTCIRRDWAYTKPNDFCSCGAKYYFSDKVWMQRK